MAGGQQTSIRSPTAWWTGLYPEEWSGLNSPFFISARTTVLSGWESDNIKNVGILWSTMNSTTILSSSFSFQTRDVKLSCSMLGPMYYVAARIVRPEDVDTVTVYQYVSKETTFRVVDHCLCCSPSFRAYTSITSLRAIGVSLGVLEHRNRTCFWFSCRVSWASSRSVQIGWGTLLSEKVY